MIANLPSDQLTFRQLNLPPASRELRARVVREELLYSLPFPLEDSAWDWTEQGDVACVLVAPLKRLREARRQVGDRARLDAEPLSYLRAARAAGITEALVVDLGARRTTLCGIRQGGLDWVRVSMRGGEALTRHLAACREIPLQEAEALKRAQGVALPEVREWLGRCLDEALLPRPLAWERGLLCGGGAALPGLAEALQASLHVPFELFPVPAGLDPHRDVPAYGAALAIRPGAPRVVLQEQPRAAAALRPVWLLWVALLVGLASADLSLRQATARARLEAQRALLQAALQLQAPELAEVPPDQLPEALQAGIREALARRRRAPGPLLDTLGQLARPLQARPGLELRAFSLSGGRLTVEGQGSGLDEVESFRQDLGGILQDLESIQVKTSATGKVVFTFEGAVPDP